MSQQELNDLQRKYKKLQASHSDLHLRYRLIADKFRCETAARICAGFSANPDYEDWSLQVTAEISVTQTDALITELEKSRVDPKE